MKIALTFSLLPETFSICRLPHGSAIPLWALIHSFFSITQTNEELSIVCPDAATPTSGIQAERNFRCLRVQNPLDFATTGVLASILEPLAQAQISIFSISTYDTDYVLVKEANLQGAIEILTQAGHSIDAKED
jgi:hypothetical protein